MDGILDSVVHMDSPPNHNNNNNYGTTAAPTPPADNSNSNSNKRKGRTVSTIWQYFTAIENPHQLKSGACMHCQKEIPYLKKIERVKIHLLKCPVFGPKMMAMHISERPEWFVEYHANARSNRHRRRKSPNPHQRGKSNHHHHTKLGAPLSAAQRKRHAEDDDDDDEEEDEEEDDIHNENVEMITVIHCWSAPRSRSTALLYSFEARNGTPTTDHDSDEDETASSAPDPPLSHQYSTIALDEPLYASWLLHESEQEQSNITRPYLRDIQKAAARNRRNTADEFDSDEDAMLLLEWQEQLQPLSNKLRMATKTLLLRDWKNGYCRNKVIFCKHMAKFWTVYDRQRDEVSEFQMASVMPNTNTHTTHPNHPTPERIVRFQHYHVVLLRDPVDVVTSWNAIGTNVYGNVMSFHHTPDQNHRGDDDTRNSATGGGNTIHEIGMVPLLQIYSALHNNQNNNNNNRNGNNAALDSVFVLDAEELIQDSERTLQRLCHHCHIPYTNAMMSWKSGPHACDGPWAKYWYHDVHQTTGWITKNNENDEMNDSQGNNENALAVVTKQKKHRAFNPTYTTALRASYPAYTFLYRLTERYQQRTTLSKAQLYPDDARNEHVFVYIGNSPGYGQCVPRDMAGVSPFDSVVQGGDATWEGIRVYRGKILCLEKHLNRLMKSAKALGFNMQYIHTKEQITDAIFQVLAINNMRDGAHMRLTLTRGEKCTSSMNPNFNVYGTTLIILPEWKPVHGVTTYDNTTGISLITASQRRNPPSCVDSKIHHNNLINNILPKIQANLAGVADAIMLDIDGYVSETNATNLFMVDEHGTLLTPHADHCLPGITRSAVLELAQELRIRTEVRRISLAEFHSAQEVFTTGTMGELTPVVNIDGRIIGDGVCGPVTQQLQQIYQTLPDRYGWSTPIPPFE